MFMIINTRKYSRASLSRVVVHYYRFCFASLDIIIDMVSYTVCICFHV